MVGMREAKMEEGSRGMRKSQTVEGSKGRGGGVGEENGKAIKKKKKR